MIKRNITENRCHALVAIEEEIRIPNNGHFDTQLNSQHAAMQIGMIAQSSIDYLLWQQVVDLN